MSNATAEKSGPWQPERAPWGRADLAALLIWTVAIVAFFRDLVSFQGALFYFDVTEINFPYRDFFARELRAGRLSRWCPGLYCGLPLYSESQAGFFHPLKYLLYPWLPTWKAFNLDTVLSVWLTGLGTYGWLRRHAGPIGALTGAAVFGFGGFVWAHLIHTSMINALISVPFIFWALEAGWDRGRLWPIVLGSVSLACQIFAGHLQDTILTVGALGLYTVYRAATESGGLRKRLTVVGMATVLVGLGGMLAAVQWIPSKELLDRSPRAGGLSWDDLTYGSWSPELLPTLIVREAYGTRARDTDWLDGFYPYHEMNAYFGIAALALAVVGAAAYRDRWVAFQVLLAGVGGVLMLGRFTALFDFAHHIPIFGSSRIPVRYHLWVSLGIAGLAAVGADRLARPGVVRLRAAVLVIGLLVLASLPILVNDYAPIWTRPDPWTLQYHRDRYRWLGNELILATVRTTILAISAWVLASRVAGTTDPLKRSRLAWLIPVLVIADLLGAHFHDVPTVPPSYWTDMPASARSVKADPAFVRLFGFAKRHSGEPGYASETVEFLTVRDTLDWSLPLVWDLPSSRGATPIIPRRHLEFTDTVKPGDGRYEIEGVTHVVSGTSLPGAPEEPTRVGAAWIYRIRRSFPRVRLMGLPFYANGESAAVQALKQLGPKVRMRLVVEDPTHPLPIDALALGKAGITREIPERVEVETDASTDSYLVMSDTFDPGWTATVDGKAAPIRPAFVAFRAVFVPKGRHAIVFRYEPVGFKLGLGITGAGIAAALVLLLWPRRTAALDSEHAENRWPRSWPAWGLAAVAVLMVLSTLRNDPSGQHRWIGSFHKFTWGSGIEAMHRK